MMEKTLKDKILSSGGLFTWSFNVFFHIETEFGDFEWSSPSYMGDNTIRPCGSYAEWLQERDLEFGRDKGWHKIREYCGEGVRFKE